MIYKSREGAHLCALTHTEMQIQTYSIHTLFKMPTAMTSVARWGVEFPTSAVEFIGE